MILKGEDLSGYFENRNPIVKEIFTELSHVLQEVTVGDFKVECKKTSIHIVAKSAFLGVSYFKDFLRLNIVLTRGLDKDKVYKVEKVSKNRFHNELTINSPQEINGDVKALIKEAYILKS